MSDGMLYSTIDDLVSFVEVGLILQNDDFTRRQS